MPSIGFGLNDVRRITIAVSNQMDTNVDGWMDGWMGVVAHTSRGGYCTSKHSVSIHTSFSGFAPMRWYQVAYAMRVFHLSVRRHGIPADIFLFPVPTECSECADGRRPSQNYDRRKEGISINPVFDELRSDRKRRIDFFPTVSFFLFKTAQAHESSRWHLRHPF